MDNVLVNEFPFVEHLPRREKSKVAKLWEDFQKLAALAEVHGMLIPPALVAELLGVSVQRVHQLMESGRLDRIEFNGRPFVTENSLKTWAESEHRNGRPPLVKEPTIKEAFQMAQHFVAAEKAARSKKKS